LVGQSSLSVAQCHYSVNDMTSSITDNLILCEFHDSRIGEVIIGFPSQLTIVFQEFNCYYKTNDSRIADVWVCEATLRFAGFEKASLSLMSIDDSLVSDIDFNLKGASDDNSNLPLLQGRECIRSHVVLTSGSEIVVYGGTAQLAITNKVRFLETFEL